MTTNGEKFNRYGFVVRKDANKVAIKQAIEKMYSVSVEKISTMNYSGKLKSRFTKTGLIEGKQNDVKKAIVTLADGDMIDFYSNI